MPEHPFSMHLRVSEAIRKLSRAADLAEKAGDLEIADYLRNSSFRMARRMDREYKKQVDGIHTAKSIERYLKTRD
jgi:hypothetical protein